MPETLNELPSGGLWIICDDLEKQVVHRLSSTSGIVPLYLPANILRADTSCIAILSTSADTVDYIAVATAGRKGSEIERKVAFGPAIQFDEPLDITKFLVNVSPRFKQHVKKPERRVADFRAATWNALLQAIVDAGGTDADTINGLNDVIESRRRTRVKVLPDAILFERDATAVALETFRGSQVRQRYLGASPTSADAPFIKTLERSGAAVLEDRMIDNDLSTFPGATAIRRHIVGAVTISLDTGSLTVVNANRTGIEKTLGVDLVYYHHSFDCFTMVQYKRMTGGEDQPVYRPDSDASYSAEIERMKQFLTCRSNDSPCDVSAFRIGENPFFFKLCEAKQEQHWSRMLPGMYVPLDLWQRLILSDSVRGPRGGIAIGYGNAERKMNNSDFVRLVRGGWIGSCGNDSNRINAIIERELAADKSIIAAVHRERVESDDRLRDRRGRFVSEDDPELF